MKQIIKVLLAFALASFVLASSEAARLETVIASPTEVCIEDYSTKMPALLDSIAEVQLQLQEAASALSLDMSTTTHLQEELTTHCQHFSEQLEIKQPKLQHCYGKR